MKHFTTAVKSLYEHGVHFVLCKKSKAAITSGWQNKRPTLKAVLKHADSDGLLGFIPGRSNLLVVDIDHFPGDVVDAGPLIERLAVQPLLTVSTRRGLHLYFKIENRLNPLGNRNWSMDGYSGEIRGDRGYVICWSIPQLADALDRLAAATPTADSLFPKGGKAGPELVEGNRNNALNGLIFRKAQAGQTEFGRERATALAAGLDVAEVDATIRSASESATSRTFPHKDADALEAALDQLGVKVRYNNRAMVAETSTDGGSKWTRTSDRLSADLRRSIAASFSYRLADNRGIAPLRFGLEAWNEHLNALMFHLEVDPFKVWLEGLPTWDGKKRLHRLLTDTLKAEDGPLTRWASTYLTLAAVQRAYEPGCLLREIPILIGVQNLGKSQLLNHLLPVDHPEWFSDSISMAEAVQKRIEGVLGRVICELSELTGFSRADQESLKSFISRRDDGAVRLAYRHDPETALRRFILVGTSNDPECLPSDPSGNSRYVPVLCRGGSNVEQFMAVNREHLWSEAVSIYRESNGEIRANLPRNLMSLQTDRAELHRRKDQVVEDSVADIEGDGYTMAQLCGMTTPTITPTDRRAVGRLADALRLQGWTKRRERTETGDLVYLWRR